MAASVITITTASALTVPEAARRLSIHRSTVYQILRDGQLAFCMVRDAIRIPEDAIVAFLQRSCDLMSGTLPAVEGARRPTLPRRRIGLRDPHE